MIYGLSDIRRLPRAGVIRTGIKQVSEKSGKEYPVATDYLVCPPEVQKVFGEKPKELEIRLAIDGDLDTVFPTFYKLYGASAGLKARSDGKTIWAKQLQGDKAVWIEEPVDDPKKLAEAGFRAVGELSFLIPKVSMAGVYTIRTGSFNSIVNIQSSLDFLKTWIGRVAFIPLKLCLVPFEAHLVKDGKPFKKTAYALQIKWENEDVMKFVADRKKFLEAMRDQGTAALSASQATLPAKDKEEQEEAPEDSEQEESQAAAYAPETETEGIAQDVADDVFGPTPDENQGKLL